MLPHLITGQGFSKWQVGLLILINILHVEYGLKYLTNHDQDVTEVSRYIATSGHSVNVLTIVKTLKRETGLCTYLLPYGRGNVAL